MRLFSLVVVVASAGCTYPEFGFSDAGAVVVDSVAPDDTRDSFVAPADTPDESDATDVVDAAPAPPSCAAIHTASPSLPSGVFTIDPDGAGPIAPFAAYCEMEDDGGGWTLALKLDGAKKTFVYDSPLWTNSETLNPTAAALDVTEAKLASFFTMPFTSLRLGMLEGTRRYLHLDVAASSLRALFSGPAVTTSAGRTEWFKILADPQLQTNCALEGVNHDLSLVVSYGARARIGIFGNNETDCDSPDSYIGFGAGFIMPHMCAGTDPGIVVGNFNPGTCGPATVQRKTTAFGYILLR